MSMTLILWKGPPVEGAEAAQALLETWYETGDDTAFEPSDDLQIMYDELLRQYPMDWDKGADPWADGPDNTGRLLVLSLRWGGQSRILADIPVLAKKLELILFDPQGPDVFLPSDPLPSDEPLEPPTLAEHLKIIAMAIVLGALTFAAWLIPIGWLRWPAVVVAGFFFIASLIVVYAMFEGRKGDAPPT